MDDLTYTIGLAPVNSSPLKGKYLLRAIKGRLERAYAGADLYCGVSHLVEPNLAQAASITGSSANDVWWAVQRMQDREAILAGELPLVPPRKKPLLPVLQVDDAVIIDFVRRVGVSRVLDAAVAVEAAQ